MSGAVCSEERSAQTLEISPAGVQRYLGMGTSQPDDALAQRIDRGIAAFRSVAQLRACWLEVPVQPVPNGVQLGSLVVPGKSLATHLEGCRHAVLFAATTGMGPEQQRRRAAVTSPAQALVLDAVGTVAIEAYCDALCERWRNAYTGRFLRPRFSPGYGDMPLTMQRPLLDLLDAQRRAGITLTQSLLMLPQKSVSACVGIGDEGCTSQAHDCSLCEKQNCAFRL